MTAAAVVQLRVGLARFLLDESRPLIVAALAAALASTLVSDWSGDHGPCLAHLAEARSTLRAGVPDPLDAIDTLVARSVAQSARRSTNAAARRASVARTVATAAFIQHIRTTEVVVYAITLSAPTTRNVMAMLNVLKRGS